MSTGHQNKTIKTDEEAGEIEVWGDPLTNWCLDTW